MAFNPFKNQHSFFYNKDLVNVLRMFTLRLNREANEMKRNTGEWNDDTKLKTAAKILKCCIKVFEIDSDGKKLQPVIHAPVVGRDVLFLFKYSGVPKKFSAKSPPRQADHKIINIYKFGMSLHHAIPLRREAMGHILKRTNLSHNVIRGIQLKFSGEENFLISLLGEDSRDEVVSAIYASPYIAWKLAAAGCNTDPCCQGPNELSAFYYCLGLDSTFLLHLLYDYAANNFEHSDKTTRNPNPDILRALRRIGNALLNDRLQSKDFSTLGDKKDIALKSYEEILCFNEYQRRIVEEINELRGNLSPHVNQSPDKSGNTTERKQIIESLLKIYPKYFYYPSVSQAHDTATFDEKFQNYIQRSEYFENLDNYTCFLFFDNFLYLDLPADVMNSAVQNLFLTVFGYSLFPKCLHGVHCNKHALVMDHCTLRGIPFIFRSNFLESSKIVHQKLNDPSPDTANVSPKHQPTKKTEEHDPNSILTKVTSGLKDLPEIRDAFLIGRLKRYLNVAASVDLSKGDMKGILTVERVLQVIGETLKTSESNSVIGHLLCSCLCKDVTADFYKIRNHCLSKYRPRAMGGKLSLEKEILRFRNIQDAIIQVDSIVDPVFVSQEGRILDHMIKRGLHECKNINSPISQRMEFEYSGQTGLLSAKYIRNKEKYKLLVNNLLKYIKDEESEKKCHKFRKIGQFSALKFLFSFLVNKCDEKIQDEILLNLQDLDKLSKYFENKANVAQRSEIEISTNESQEIIKIISELSKITDSIFSDTKQGTKRVIDNSVVGTFFSDARNFNWFTDAETSTIEKKISELLQLSREAKAHLKEFLVKRKKNDVATLSENEAQLLVENIFAAQKDRNLILENLFKNCEAALKTLNSIKKDDQDVFRKKSDGEDDLDCLIKFSETEEGRNLLLKIEIPEDLHQKILQFLNRKVEFLLDRIYHLKCILIDEDILNLWNWGKSEAIKTHIRFLMGQRYRREKDVRASLEMLLFDCMNILKSRASLSHLWLKANDLFSGANLRDILSHGSTILEIVAGCLDKDDLPSHLIDKMLELIEDGDALSTLSGLWQKSKTTDLKQFESILTADAKDDPSLREVQRWMDKRSEDVGGWRDYLLLFPLK